MLTWLGISLVGVSCCFNYINALGKLKSHTSDCRERKKKGWWLGAGVASVCIFFNLMPFSFSSVNIIYKEVSFVFFLFSFFSTTTCSDCMRFNLRLVTPLASQFAFSLFRRKHFILMKISIKIGIHTLSASFLIQFYIRLFILLVLF